MKLTKIIIVLFLLFLMPTVVEAVGIGISPPRVIADNLLRGSHFEKTVILSRGDVSEELIVTINIEGQLEEWISTDLKEGLAFPKGKRILPITITIDVPKDAANGKYESDIRIRGKAATNPDTGFIGSSVVAGILVTAKATVTGDQILDFSIPLIKIPTTEEGSPINILLTLDNIGNVKARPTKVSVEIFDKFQKNILLKEEVTDLKSIDPFTRGEIIVQVPHNLGKNQYWATIKVYNGEMIVKEEKIIFDVLEEGSLRKKGVLKEIITKAKVSETELVKITAPFENTGEGIISAKFVAEVSLRDTLIQVIESEPVIVAVGKTELLDVYFTPPKSGRYTVRGYISYAGKKTEIKEVTFTVGKGIPINASTIVIAILALLFTIKWLWKKRWFKKILVKKKTSKKRLAKKKVTKKKIVKKKTAKRRSVKKKPTKKKLVKKKVTKKKIVKKKTAKKRSVKKKPTKKKLVKKEVTKKKIVKKKPAKKRSKKKTSKKRIVESEKK